MSEVKKTPIYEEHLRASAKIVEFAGWMMPVEYAGLRKEHHCVRENVGLFDVSHMGEIRFRGPKALETLEWLTSNHVAKLSSGQAQYSLLPNEAGGLVDDIIIYCFEKGTDYLVCVNAANTAKDFAWMQKHNRGAEITDESSKWGQIAVQGPKALELVSLVFSPDVLKIESFQFSLLPYQGQNSILARTGYTGEDGLEIFVPQDQAASLWRELLQKGTQFGVQPIGLGARDTLRTEMKYSLYGQEIDDQTSPYEAGLGWVVKPDLKDFLGKGPILAAKEQGLKRKLVGFKMLDRGIPRHSYPVVDESGEALGHVTSGTLSPTLNDNIGIAYVKVDFSAPGSKFYVQIRDRRVLAEVVPTPFVKVKGAK